MLINLVIHKSAQYELVPKYLALLKRNTCTRNLPEAPLTSRAITSSSVAVLGAIATSAEVNSVSGSGSRAALGAGASREK